MALALATTKDNPKDETNGTAFPDARGYERGVREPSLIVLLKYARLAGCAVEDLIDDKMKWP